MTMSVDESGKYNSAHRIDDLGVPRIYVRPDCDDFLAFDKDVSIVEVANRGIDCEHATAFQQNATRIPRHSLHHLT
jgi:hypothetical protein